MKTSLLALLLLILGLGPAVAQTGTHQEDREETMSVEDYDPRSTLVVPENPVPRAKYPFVDVHSHQWGAPTMTPADIDTLLMQMDNLNLAVMVNLSGRSGNALRASVDNLEGHAPNRFVTFANIDFDGVGEPNWTENTVAQLEADVAAGARGLKIYKNLGMDTFDVDSSRVATDDPRLDPIWAKCGELGIPVLIHTADPAMFWQDRNRTNERWLELKVRPRRYRSPATNPSFETLLAEQHNTFRKHPNTIFIAAHLGWLGSDLAALGELLDEMPNVYTEVGAVLHELGRQPRFAREFLTKYKDRVMFGKDSWRPEEFPYFFRTFETADEYFPYYRKYHAHWRLYGLDLPDDVLRHLYYKTALNVIPGLDAALFPAG